MDLRDASQWVHLVVPLPRNSPLRTCTLTRVSVVFMSEHE